MQGGGGQRLGHCSIYCCRRGGRYRQLEGLLSRAYLLMISWRAKSPLVVALISYVFCKTRDCPLPGINSEEARPARQWSRRSRPKSWAQLQKAVMPAGEDPSKTPHPARSSRSGEKPVFLPLCSSQWVIPRNYRAFSGGGTSRREANVQV